MINFKSLHNDFSKIKPKANSNKKTLQQFLLKHLIKKGNVENKTITNTRIGEKNGIMGGSYSISDNEYYEFLNVYDRDILQKKNKSEYLTEKQLVNDGPLLVDIDLRYDIEIDSRQHTSNHINDLIENYLCILSEFYKMDKNTLFKIFVMEKQM